MNPITLSRESRFAFPRCERTYEVELRDGDVVMFCQNHVVFDVVAGPATRKFMFVGGTRLPELVLLGGGPVEVREL